ncbi:MAG: sensor domain-containing diguanylate cyclase [Nitrospirae bacterium]|nr:sensor domain-containing diguanylate cyclase [Nitrospirota bacterium]
MYINKMENKPVDHEKDILDIILNVNKSLFSTLETKDLLFLIVQKISEVVPVTRCSIVNVDKDKDIGNVLATFEDAALDSITLDLNKYPEIIRAAKDDSIVYIGDVGTDPTLIAVRDKILCLGIKSIIIMPIHYYDNDKGSLFLRTSKKGGKFSEHDLKLCQVIIDGAAVALKNAHLFNVLREEKLLLEKLVITDDLTRLYNHKYFVRRLDEEFKRAKRYSSPLSCMMIDLDNFKRVNDTYGHQAGDKVLKDVAKVLKKSVRETDIIARYGGEEFSVILPNSIREDALRLAERICRSVRSFVFDCIKEGENITVSIGVTTYPHPDVTDFENLIRKADNALYKAKEGGKDRVVSL